MTKQIEIITKAPRHRFSNDDIALELSGRINTITNTLTAQGSKNENGILTLSCFLQEFAILSAQSSLSSEHRKKIIEKLKFWCEAQAQRHIPLTTEVRKIIISYEKAWGLTD